MASFRLFPHTPFPKEEFKDLIIGLKDGSPRLLGLRLWFSDAITIPTGRIMASISSDNVADIDVRYHIHENGGRGRFLSDMSCLKNLLAETGGFHVRCCYICSLCCCANLIPDALNIFYNASKIYDNSSMECQRRELHLYGFDPNVAAKIVENWKFGPRSMCVFHPQEISQERKVLGAIFTNRNFDHVRASARYSSCPIDDGTLGFLSSLLSSPASTVQTLMLHEVSAGAEADRKLASMLASNKSLTYLQVEFTSDSWIASEMSNVMRDTNCTLKDGIYFYPNPKEGSLSHICMKEMQFYVALNKHGRASMRSTTFRPEKIPILLKKAGSAEGSRFIYPLLRENPPSWTSYLVREKCQALADCQNQPRHN